MSLEILYHATTAKGLSGIILDSSICPASETGLRVWGNCYDDKETWENVYLGNRETVERIAKIIQSEYGGTVPILEVQVNSANLTYDEDSGEDNWRDSLNTGGTCAYTGTIQDWSVDSYLPFDFSRNEKIKMGSASSRLKLSPEECSKFYSEELVLGTLAENEKYNISAYLKD